MGRSRADSARKSGLFAIFRQSRLIRNGLPFGGLTRAYGPAAQQGQQRQDELRRWGRQPGDFATFTAPEKFRKPPFRHAWEEALSSSTRTKFCPNDDCGQANRDSEPLEASSRLIVNCGPPSLVTGSKSKCVFRSETFVAEHFPLPWSVKEQEPMMVHGQAHNSRHRGASYQEIRLTRRSALVSVGFIAHRLRPYLDHWVMLERADSDVRLRVRCRGGFRLSPVAIAA